MKNATVYQSKFFSDAAGSPRLFWIPTEAIATYSKRDECLIKMHALGGIYAKPTSEFMKLRSKMMGAKRKIEKMGWFSSPVVK